MILILVLTFLLLIIIVVVDRREDRESYWSCKTFGNIQMCKDNIDEVGQYDGVLVDRVIS